MVGLVAKPNFRKIGKFKPCYEPYKFFYMKKKYDLFLAWLAGRVTSQPAWKFKVK